MITINVNVPNLEAEREGKNICPNCGAYGSVGFNFYGYGRCFKCKHNTTEEEERIYIHGKR